MKKLIICALTLIFLLFTAGSLLTVYNLVTTTDKLRYLINLHEIEDIRQELGFSIQKVQNYTFSSAAEFANNLDEIVKSAAAVDANIERCNECHHEPDVLMELDETHKLYLEYEKQLSYLITTATEGERRRQRQLTVVQTSDKILNKVQGMVNRAADTLNRKTAETMESLDRSYVFIAVTLAAALLFALYTARRLTLRITRPIEQILAATRRLSEGELGHTIDYQGQDEFATLVETLNAMSLSLAEKDKKISRTLDRLQKLHTVTLPLHGAQSRITLLEYLRNSITSLVDAEQTGIMLLGDSETNYVLYLCGPDQPIDIDHAMVLPAGQVQELYKAHGGRQILLTGGEIFWPLGPPPAGLTLSNLLLVWLEKDGKLKGAVLVINKKGTPLSEEDRSLLGILATNISVALQNIKLNRNLRQQMKELQDTQRQLVEAEKLTALGTLAGGVAHDFNNILCGIIGHIALLKRTPQREERELNMLNTIEKASFRAANLTKQLLAFSRQEVSEKRPLNLNDSAMNVVGLLRNTFSKLISIQLELDPNLPPVMGDPAQLEQVIMNLCVNARDAMPDGGTLHLSSKTVFLGPEEADKFPAAREGSYAQFSVRDHGVGMAPEVLARIFEPFYTTKEVGKGTGLGLAMAYGIIQSHDGFFDVQSVPGEGTTFTLYLPRAEKISVEEQILERDHQHTPYTIMIVDDEELISGMLAEHLEGLGATILQATNGEEALRVLADNLGAIELVILDINMPVMDGKEAFIRMKKLKPDLRVLIASGYAMDKASEEMLRTGADGFIQKPYRLESIFERIQEIMNR